VYQPGDTVHLTALASVAGTLNWQAFDSAASINLLPDTPSSFDVTLPATLVADTYEVTYRFVSTDGRVVDDAASFEVEGDRAVVRQVVLDWQATGCAGDVSARLKVESRTAGGVAAVESGDGATQELHVSQKAITTTQVSPFIRAQ